MDRPPREYSYSNQMVTASAKTIPKMVRRIWIKMETLRWLYSVMLQGGITHDAKQGLATGVVKLATYCATAIHAKATTTNKEAEVKGTKVFLAEEVVGMVENFAKVV